MISKDMDALDAAVLSHSKLQGGNGYGYEYRFRS